MNKIKNLSGYTCLLLFLVIILFYSCTAGDKEVLMPETLKCEYKKTPLGIDIKNPRLSWEIPGSIRGTFQTAYQVLVATDSLLLNESQADVWNSGKASSSENIQVACQGEPLVSSQRYYWKVRYWNQENNPSPYSTVSWWETGLLSQNDWKGKWIYNGQNAPENEADMYKDTPVPLFRKEFSVQKEIESARLYISGLGYYEAYINGNKVGDHMLDPGWTNYGKRVQYVVYDIGDYLQDGENAIGVILGNGWYNPLPLYLFNRLNLRNILTIGQPKYIAEMIINYKDDSQDIIVSDESWKSGNGPILMNNVYLGEKYDARLEQPGWDAAGFNDDKWNPAVAATPPGGRLVSQIQPPIRITRILKPIKLTEPEPGVFIFDMGQNFAGCARLTVNGPAGTRIQMRYGELLHEDGTLNDITTIACHIREGSYVRHRPGAPLNANQKDIYILKGSGQEVYNSRFTFHGFRYVEVTGFPGKPTLDNLEGLRMNADLQLTGKFSCSNQLFNQVQENAQWTFLSNVFSIESDCPGREKFGYGGDMFTASEAYLLNYDMADFYTKAVRDFQEDQRPSGGMPECAPDNAIYDEGLTKDTGPIGWMIAHPWLQDRLYAYYGDKRLLEEQYESTRRLVDFIQLHANDHIIEKGISDHGTIAPKDHGVTGTAFFYHHARMLSRIAGILGNKDDQNKYALLADSIKKAFVDKFYDTQTGKVGIGSESSQSFALYYGLYPDGEKDKIIRVLLDDIKNTNNGHISTGIFGTKLMFEALRMNDLNNAGYLINNQKEFPGYGYMVENGATTIWEHWRGAFASHNHPMFGSVSEWFFKSLAGINPGPEAAGFNRFVIKPAILPDLGFVKSSYHSIRGEIVCNWNKEQDKLKMEVTVPGNTRAQIYIPSSNVDHITESGANPEKGRNITMKEKGDDYVVYEVPSGNYSFESEL